MSEDSKGLGILLGIRPRRAESRSQYDPRLAAAKRLRKAIRSDDDSADKEFYEALKAWDDAKSITDSEDD